MTTTQTGAHEVAVPEVPTQLFIGGEWRDATDGASPDAVTGEQPRVGVPVVRVDAAHVVVEQAVDLGAVLERPQALLDRAAQAITSLRARRSSTSASKVSTGLPSGPSTSEDSWYQRSGARVPQNERQRGSDTDQRSGLWSGSPVQ